MNAGKVDRSTERVRVVAVMNGRVKQDVHIFIPPDASLPIVTDAVDLVSEKGRNGLLAKVPDELRPEVGPLLQSMSTVVSARKAETPRKTAAPATPEPHVIDPARAYEAAKALVSLGDIPKRAVKELSEMGVAGEESQIELLYLVITSRLVRPPLRPVSAIVKAISSSGKSFVVDQALRFFPSSAFYSITAMSERALVYDTEPLSHRMLVIAEATGMEGEMQQLIIRSLLSEGKLVYPYVGQDDSGKLVTFRAEREGPTGLILTTTRAAVHPENETRLLSLSVTETPEQTRAVFKATAKRVKGEGKTATDRDLSDWHALQDWLSVAEHRVDIPYVDALADLTDNRAVRMRRDFTTVLSLITARAMLHQETRDRRADGRIIATLDDYAAVARLIGELVSYGIQSSVPEKLRLTVGAVATRASRQDPASYATVQDVAAALNVEKSAAHNWVRKAMHAGYVVNNETRKRQPARLTLGDPLPSDTSALPSVADVEDRSTFHVGSTCESGTPSDGNAKGSASVPPFHVDSGGPPAFFASDSATSEKNSAGPSETGWNGGTHTQGVEESTVGVPHNEMERTRNVERFGSSLTPEEYAEEERQAAELLRRVAIEKAERARVQRASA